MADVINYRFVVKQGTTAEATANNIQLLSGELGMETDGHKGVKLGPGYWNTLPYRFLPEVNLAGLTDGSVLVYDLASDTWKVGASSGGNSTNILPNVQTGTSYTLVASDAGGDVQCNNATAVTVTIPLGIFTVGDWILSSQIGAGIVTYVGATGVAFETTGTKSTSGKGDLIGLEMIAPNVWRWIGEKVVAWLTDAPSDGTTYARKNGAWVAAGGTTGQLAGLNDQTGTSYTVAAIDAGKDIRCTNAAAVTLYINNQAAAPVTDNFWALVSQGGAGKVTVKITTSSGVLLRTPNGSATTAIYDARGIERITGDEWRVW